MKPRHINYLRGLSSQVKKYGLVVIVALALIAFVYPSAFIYPKDTLPDNNDARLIAYIIGQVQKNLIEHKPLHYGTYFAPDQNTLAYSDLFLTSALTTLPFRLFTSHPILIFNLALVIGTLLTVFFSFILFEYLLKDLWITILAVILFNFSGFHLHYLPHLQMFSLWPLFLSIYFFLRYLKENHSLFLKLFFITVTLQLAESIFPVYFIFFTVVFLLIKNAKSVAEVVTKQNRLSSMSSSRMRGSIKLVPYLYRFRVKPGMTRLTRHSLPFIPLWLYLLYPYYHLHASLPEATRPIRDAAHFSLGLDQIFTQYHSWTLIILFLTIFVIPGLTRNPLNKFRKIEPSGWIPAFAGMTLFKRKLRSFWHGPKRWLSELWFPKKNTNENYEKKWHYIFIFSIVMSLGPVLKIFGQNIRLFGFPIPLPYTLFYYLFPGFTGFRTPSRFIILALLAVCILIGFQIKPIFEKLKPKTKFIFLLLVLSLLFLEADLPLKGYPVNINMHPVYQQVKNLPPEAVILELPIKLWNMPDHEIESIRSLYSLEHNHRRLGGFSGFATNSWIDLVEKINTNGLNQKNLDRLHSLGITHIIENNILRPLINP